MLFRNLSVRYQLFLNNIIMVLVPVILLTFLGSIIFYGLRATGTSAIARWNWRGPRQAPLYPYS